MSGTGSGPLCAAVAVGGTGRTGRHASALTYAATRRPFVDHCRELEILDRVGGRDSFASGLLYGHLERGDLGSAVRRRARRTGDDDAR